MLTFKPYVKYNRAYKLRSLSHYHTGKCIRRFGGILRVLPVLQVVDIGVNTI